MFLTGRFERAFDEKHRVSIPKSLRESLGKQAEAALYIAPGLDGSLAIYPEVAFTKLVARLNESSPTAKDVRDYSRLFFSRAETARLDAQGRLRIPASLAQWAKLEKEIILLGVQERMEIWSPEKWEAYVAARQQQYDQIAESAFGGAPASPDA